MLSPPTLRLRRYSLRHCRSSATTSSKLYVACRAVALAEGEGWWRRRESKYVALLILNKLLILQHRTNRRGRQKRSAHTRITHTEFGHAEHTAPPAGMRVHVVSYRGQAMLKLDPNPGVLPIKPAPSRGEKLSFRIDGLPPYKELRASIRNPKHRHYSRFVALREAAISAMDGRAWSIVINHLKASFSERLPV